MVLVGVDAGEQTVEVCAAECPLNGCADLPVVVAEGEQPLGERVEGWSSPLWWTSRVALVSVEVLPQ